MIRFELPFLLPGLNEMLADAKRGPKARGRKAARNKLAWWVVTAMGSQRPSVPIPRARIRVERHAARLLDPDNANATLKRLLDVLQPMSTKHPAGLGVIAGDDGQRLVPWPVEQVKLGRHETPKTVVIIEEA